MHLSLQIDLIERFTKLGDTILDPMAGSGTLLFACTLGRNVILVELEDKFVKMQQANWKKIKRLGPMLGYSMGQATLLQGDSRQLDNVLADTIITSPPYGNPREVNPEQEKSYENKRLGGNKSKHGRTAFRGHYQPDVICTSPPFGSCEQRGGGLNKDDKFQAGCKWDGYGKMEGQIGNLKSDNYLSAMAQVYQQCHKVLKDGGLLCLVVKNFIRDKKIVRLDLNTIKLCENAGFILTERLAKKLTQMSFWRRIYMQKYPDAPRIDFEDVLIFKKDS